MYFILLNNTIPSASLAAVRAACFSEQALCSDNMKGLPEIVSRDAQTRMVRVDDPSSKWLNSQEWLSDPEVVVFHGDERSSETQNSISNWKRDQKL